MINKEKLLLLATIYMLVPGAMSDALAGNLESSSADGQKAKGKRWQALEKVQRKNAGRQQQGDGPVRKK